MVLDFYGLREQPFGATPDPRFIYLGRSHREALASLQVGITAGRGVMAVIAAPGTGKTTLLYQLLEPLQTTARTVFLFQTPGNRSELFRYMLRRLGQPSVGDDFATMHETLYDTLLAEWERGRRCVLVLDEAQNLEAPVLEAVRLLSDFETPSDKLLQIVLAGQPRLADTLSHSGFATLRQRISMVVRVEPFSPPEVAVYINHRLKIAGLDNPAVFSFNALALIAFATGGVPREIDNVCWNALTLGYAMRSERITEEIVQEVLGDLDLEPCREAVSRSESGWPHRLPLPRTPATVVPAEVLAAAIRSKATGRSVKRAAVNRW
jgi:general secretion pathway protein A